MEEVINNYQFHFLFFFAFLIPSLPFIFLEYPYTLLIIASLDSFNYYLKQLVMVAISYFDFLENYIAKAIHNCFASVPILLVLEYIKVQGECRVRILAI